MASQRYEDVCSELLLEGLEEDVVEIFRSNRIDKPVFLGLDRSDLQQLGITALGDKKRIETIQQRISGENVSG